MQPSVSPPRFIGQSRSLRLLPWLLITAGFFTGVSNAGRLPVSVFLLTLGAIASMAIPWRFVVTDEGIALWFGFGKRRFLARDELTVHVDLDGVRVIPKTQHFGYLLTDGIRNRRYLILTAALEEHGFHVLRS